MEWLSQRLLRECMQFWFARDSDVPIREQLFTQVVLGILSDDLPPGHRLPSTREMARRFHLHANTVSAAYRELQKARWVEFRHGSGVYVRSSKPDTASAPQFALDQLISNLFRSAREIGAPMATVRSRLRQWLAMQPPDHFLVIEPDEELRSIVISEMKKVLDFSVLGANLDICRQAEDLASAIPVALPSKVEAVRKSLPAGTECIALHVRSVPASLGEWIPVASDKLVGVASRWPGFLQSARTMLIAAGFDADALVLRDARKSGWQDGLRSTAAVITDSLTVNDLPRKVRAITFPLLAESCLDELRRYQHFISAPIE
jgi:DNA-binding transcriptional regulator YhcF (GntR family)